MNRTMNSSILRITQSGSSAAGPGPCHPPRNIAVAIPEIATMLMYSAMKNEPKRIPPNSVLYPATISASASGRSKGGLLVSANAATMKMQKPTNCGTTYQMEPCLATISVSDSEPAVNTTPSSDSASDTSYEMSCAAERMAPRNEYLDPDAQPPSINP